MKIAVMQPYFFPYIGYFQLIAAVDKFVVFDDVNFINKGWINRNNILINNAASLISLPLSGASQNKLINEINIIDQKEWASKFLRTLEGSYKKAPYFEEVFKLIQNLILFENKNLSAYLCNSIQNICEYLSVTTIIEHSSAEYETSELKGQEKILKICATENATDYINPIGGLELYSNNKFENCGIKLSFIKTKEVKYTQYKNEFVPYLSIIDVLMFNGKNTKDFLTEFLLVKNGE